MSESIEEQNIHNRGRVVVITPPRYVLESLYLGAISEKSAYETCVRNAENYNDLFNFILDLSPNFLVSKVTFEKFKSQMETLARLKERLPQTKLIVFGEPFLTYNNNVTYENPFIDYVITGEAECTLTDILDGIPDNEILGICYTDDNMQSVKNEQRPFLENLDELLLPARHLQRGQLCNEIEVSRGCPYNCLFCLATTKNGAACRVRQPQNIINEIVCCIKTYGIKQFNFKADIFNFDNNWVKELCNAIIESKLNITWSCDVVPKNINEELVKLMYKSGCRLCRIGAESGSDKILEKIDKDITKESIIETVTLLRKNKIKTNVFYLIGLPWETEATAKETIDFSTQLDSEKAVFNIPIPFPATKFFVYSMLNKLFIPPQENKTAKNMPLCKTHTLSIDKVFELRNYAENKFYSKTERLLNKIINIFKKSR